MSNIRNSLPPLRDISEGLQTTPGHLVVPPTTPGQPGESPDHSQTSGRANRPHLDIHKILPDIRKGLQPLPIIREGLSTTHECPVELGRPSRIFGSARKALPNFREWSGVVRRPSRMTESGLESFLQVREWSGGPPG